MNKNIKVINDNLWLVDFQYIMMGYIKEITFINAKADDPMCLTNDGKLVLNSSIKECNRMIPLIEAIMKIPTNELNMKKGFIEVTKILIPGIGDYTDEKVLQLTDKPIFKNTKLLYDTFCRWEVQRRLLKLEYDNKEKLITKLRHKFIKRGVK